MNVSDREEAEGQVEEREDVQILIADGDREDRLETVEDEEGSETEEMAGFGILAALGGLGGAAYLFVRRFGRD
ncbi:MAG: PGF-CTERM sorting domain-containing protein [Euryarchaeota archaeon]|nr:PGF-CTERM sorting domain-containing protein [Euryarchaeota archaeon]